MTYEEYAEKMELLMKLIRYQNTGSPTELAKVLHVSERTARRMIAKLRSQHEIVFSRRSNSYVLKE